MSIRMRRPEEVKLPLTRGDWLLVKKHLTAGEQRQMFSGMLREHGADVAVNPVKVGCAKILAYLLDWSFEDPDGKPIDIRDKPTDVVGAALDNIDGDAFAEVLAAIDAHIDATTAAVAAEKNVRDGESKSPAISPSAG